MKLWIAGTAYKDRPFQFRPTVVNRLFTECCTPPSASPLAALWEEAHRHQAKRNGGAGEPRETGK